jgi:dUTP pyrophosphatase
MDPFPNSGFDLFVPEETSVGTDVKMVSMDVKCEMLDKDGYSIPYYMYPRSSLSKTPLMLANHVGIIDSGYRGFLIGAFRNLNMTSYTIEKHNRLLQVCHPSLCPIHVVMVDESELSSTSRGAGGFGSTGK